MPLRSQPALPHRLRQGLALLVAGLGLAAWLPASGAAATSGPSPATRYAPGSAGMQEAQSIARQRWGADACGGQVALSWARGSARINARSSWSNPTSAYDDPALNVDCRIVLNPSVPFDWEMFCTVLVHEYGHLTGHAHVDDGPDVMSSVYHRPLAACAATPDPTPSAGTRASRASVRATDARNRNKAHRAGTRSRQR